VGPWQISGESIFNVANLAENTEVAKHPPPSTTPPSLGPSRHVSQVDGDDRPKGIIPRVERTEVTAALALLPTREVPAIC
jgi:hypothetical protein